MGIALNAATRFGSERCSCDSLEACVEWFYDWGFVCTSDGAFVGAVACQLDAADSVCFCILTGTVVSG